MQRIILIVGPGRGKSHLANLLADYYTNQGTPHKLIRGREVDVLRALKALASFQGYVIIDDVEPGVLPSPFIPWQRIEVWGAYDAG